MDTIVVHGVTFDVDTAQAVAALSIWHDDRNTDRRIRPELERELCDLLGEDVHQQGLRAQPSPQHDQAATAERSTRRTQAAGLTARLSVPAWAQGRAAPVAGFDQLDPGRLHHGMPPTYG